ncbi:MAG: HEAT repeat domain-containing protein [Pirellulales bacterium]
MVGVSVILSVGATVRADVFELANGGRVEGRLLDSADEKRSTLVIELAAGGRLTIPRSQIARVESISADDAEYENLARSSPDTIEAHLKMAEWCRERKLRDKAQQHWERVLELDPNHEAARGALGFRQKDGQWMTRDDVMASRGLVLYEGRYVTPQHVELLERQKQNKVSQADWANELERLRRGLTGRRQDRAAQAHVEIQQIRDPLAAEALVAMLRRETDPELKRLWIEVASRLDHRLAIDALVDLSLTDPEPEIRHDCLEYLIKSGRPGLVTPYIRALKDRDNEIVNRAGAALGQIGDSDAISPLIDALVTTHKFKVGDANPDQHAYTFSSDGSAFSFGGGGPQIITQPIRNPAVLSALVTLSGGTSFDYDQEQWRRWLAAQAKLNAVDVRRDQ